MGIRIITDSASDIVHPEREDLQILPIIVTFGETEYLDGITLSQREFYEKLAQTDELPKTSQITPYAFSEKMQEAVSAGDDAVVITLAGKLSSTYQNACAAAQDFEGRIFVVDSENASIGEQILVRYALRLKDEGLSASEIARKLDTEKQRICLIALLDTLEYLRKGGRISKLEAFAGGLLSIKPVITLVRGEVAVLGKARGSRQGATLLSEQIRKSGGPDFSMPFLLGYTGLSDALLQKYISDNEDLWKSHDGPLPICPVGGTIGTHTGPNAIAAVFFR